VWEETVNQWTEHEAEFEKLLGRIRELAERSGFVLNPDAERVSKVVGLMTNNLVDAGKRYCPCKQSHPLDVKADVLCPCPTWREEIARDGHCACRLFFSKA
jgi:ferredoxin-thioredoxin reductase catalytic subunit